MPELTSFVHSRYPGDCASPNVFTSEGLDAFPGFFGTGFFARRGDEVFYITARHCLTRDCEADIASIAARLHIPYSLTGTTQTSEDCVEFEDIISLGHNSDEVPGAFLDFVVLTVRRSRVPGLHEKLLARAVKLPPAGAWLDQFMAHPLVRDGVDARSGIVCTIVGYPREGTASGIDYPDALPVEIVSQSVRISGRLAAVAGFDRYRLDDISWVGDLDGLSGAPVTVDLPVGEGRNYALAGMVVTGGAGKMHFIRIGLIVEALNATSKR